MPRPFLAYLRVYQPVSTFEEPLAGRLRAALEKGSLDRSAASERERLLWLRAQVAAPARLLPGDRADGKAANLPLDVLMLRTSEVPATETATVGPGPLVCPLDLRPRAAAALVGFLASNVGPLRDAAIGCSAETARGRASSAMTELTGGAVHVLSSTWTVPLPWFALVDPASRHVVLAPADDPQRTVCWRVAMSDARRRVARAHKVVSESLGEAGPTRVLRDVGRWLEHFHAHSAVELDYGGLVQLLDDDTLLEDTSAADVHLIVDALESGDAEQVAEHYERLRDFWGELATRERLG